MSRERRVTDVGKWEKRFISWGIAAMVAMGLNYLANTDKNMALVKKELTFNQTNDDIRNSQISTLNETVYQLAITQSNHGQALDQHDRRLCDVESRVLNNTLRSKSNQKEDVPL